jgi:hypothetical protein
MREIFQNQFAIIQGFLEQSEPLVEINDLK